MVSSEMLRHVAVVRPDVSVELSATFIKGDKNLGATNNIFYISSMVHLSLVRAGLMTFGVSICVNPKTRPFQ
jgi:hypothetical protein